MSRFGRREEGEPEVDGRLDRLVEEVAARDREIRRLETENRQLKHALREWHRQMVGYDAAELIARAQVQIEAQIANAEAYSRERELEATQRYDAILAEAQQRADSDVEPQWAGRQRAYAGAVLHALDAVAAQVDATRQAFSFEVGTLPPPPGSLPGSPLPKPLEPAAPAPDEPDPEAEAELEVGPGEELAEPV
jgi:hypothetical protein